MKENNWVDNLAARLVETGIATMETINGCSEEELLNIEKFYSLKLPEAYKDYMRKFGKASGDFLRECGIYYPSVLRNRRRATTLLNNNTDYKLKRSDFVFITRYGCQFYFFGTAGKNPNPPVFRYTENSDVPMLLADSFEAAITMAADEYFELEKNPLLNVESKFYD
ncbi:MAG: SMI1/KNR4 family protein [Candidatus Obscuribacter sp.]|nr:SMI1/KNR4 family protein [Candidatus Obscuribacter sp.]MBP6595739.1 SMI1/KNR4 family protein [Candidatus Obscuribacter sp.]MBP7579160.1 SMI1/KNR4 family protein [Candidatus Obscuribacter sp.]